MASVLAPAALCRGPYSQSSERAGSSSSVWLTAGGWLRDQRNWPEASFPLVLRMDPKASCKLRTCSPVYHTQRTLGAKSGQAKAGGNGATLTREEEPKLPTEALGNALQDQLPSSGCSVHAHATPVLKEVDAPGLLLHLLLGLREGMWSVELKSVSVLRHGWRVFHL